MIRPTYSTNPGHHIIRKLQDVSYHGVAREENLIQTRSTQQDTFMASQFKADGAPVQYELCVTVTDCFF